MEICGREKEKKLFAEILENRDTAQFIAIYGRRRVGKTYLVKNYFSDKGVFFKFTGMKGASLKEHLELFRSDIIEQLVMDEKVPPFKNWIDAFLYLRGLLKKIDRNHKIILFLDELPWIATRKSGFLKALEHFWNHVFSDYSNGILIVCGSAASWMLEKIIHNKGGLHNRLTLKVRLEPFSLKETEQYLQYKNINLERKQIVDLYLLTGGVAKYLDYVKKGLSAAQNIQNMCFNTNAPLLHEFHELFSSLFDNSSEHIEIVKLLAKKRTGLTQYEIIEGVKKTSGGHFSSLLIELKEAGFIDFIPSYNKKKKNGKYYLIDEYSFFYLTWLKNLEDSKTQYLSDDYWLGMHGRTSYLAWAGFAFETICRKNIKQVVEALGISAVATQAINWQSEGAQIDLIIDREDNCMNLCEIKYYSTEVKISSEMAKKINFRREFFREKTKTKKALFNTLISVYGAKKNSAFLGAFEKEVVLDDFFI